MRLWIINDKFLEDVNVEYKWILLIVDLFVADAILNLSSINASIPKTWNTEGSEMQYAVRYVDYMSLKSV